MRIEIRVRIAKGGGGGISKRGERAKGEGQEMI